MIVDSAGAVVWEFNGITASSLLSCRVITHPSDFGMTWKLGDHAERLTIDQSGQYAVVVKHEHIIVQKDFTVN
jgi:hypothetical protein